MSWSWGSGAEDKHLLPHNVSAAFAERFPAAWERIIRRREFMAASLGIELHPDVLPLSNLPAVLAPFLLRPDRAMAMVE